MHEKLDLLVKLNLTKSLEYNLRFWYEMGGDEDIRFTPAELKEIRKVSLARILCDNTKDVTKMQPHAFMTSDSNDNKEVSCDDTSNIPKLDITPFRGVGAGSAKKRPISKFDIRKQPL